MGPPCPHEGHSLSTLLFHAQVKGLQGLCLLDVGWSWVWFGSQPGGRWTLHLPWPALLAKPRLPWRRGHCLWRPWSLEDL